MKNLLKKWLFGNELYKLRRYEVACSQLDRWLANDPKSVLLIKAIDDYANDKAPLWEERTRDKLRELDKCDCKHPKNKYKYSLGDKPRQVGSY